MGSEHKVVKIDINTGSMDEDLQHTLDEHHSEGWNLFSIIPITSGKSAAVGSEAYGEGGGWGFGYTSHLLITFSR